MVRHIGFGHDDVEKAYLRLIDSQEKIKDPM